MDDDPESNGPDTNHPELNYAVMGPENGPALALIHGFMSSNVQWDLNRSRLSDGLRLVLVEQTGHGRSPGPDDVRSYGRGPMLAALETIRERLGIDRWFVGGHSLGGAVALRYGLTHPERILGVVFTNTRAAFGLDRHRAPGEGPTITDGLTSLRDLPFHPIHAKRFPADLQARMVAVADAMAPHVLAHTVAQRNDWSTVDEMAALSAPALLINGRYERAFQPCVAEARAAIPDLEIVELDGGHSVNIEMPEGFDRAVLDFIARVSGSAAQPPLP